jgi:opacity protein-like surface antigen
VKSYVNWLALLLVAAPASAQRFEAAGLFGYTTSGSLEPVASELEGYEIGGGFTWQGQFDYFFSPHLGVEASWAQREGELTLSTSSGTGELFEIDMRQLLGSVVYQWGTEEAKVRPFVLGGLGATFFESDDVPSETKLAWAVGGGAKLFFHRRLGLKLQAKFNPTLLNDESSDFCDPFGFCADSVSSFELLSGVFFRF